MKSYVFDLEVSWTRHLPFLLGKLGAYQGWVNADKVIDQSKFATSRYDYKPLGTVTDILKDLSRRPFPVAPALIVDRSRLDGTSTPSTQSTDTEGKCWKIPDLGQNFAKVTFSKIFCFE